MITEIHNLIQSFFVLEGATVETQAFLDLLALGLSATVLITCIVLLFKMFFGIVRMIFRG